MNVIILTGRLTRDPEFKIAPGGKCYSRFSLAVNRDFSRDGEADFINCVAFNKTAELIRDYLKKGRKAGVTGRLQMNRYEVNGENRISYDVLVQSVEFLESKEVAREPQEWKEPRATKRGYQDQEIENVEDDDDDEFPF